MSAGMIILICALVVAVVLIVFLAVQLEKYIVGFRDVATQLYNVTAERNKLSIANEGLQARLNKVSTLKPEPIDPGPLGWGA